MRQVAIALMFCATTCAAPGARSAVDPLTRLPAAQEAPYRVDGRGSLRDSTHPRFPGDSLQVGVRVAVFVDPPNETALIELRADPDDGEPPERYYVRRGRIFQVDRNGAEIAAQPLADLPAATLAALHPAIVAGALRARRENLAPGPTGTLNFAWNDALWRVEFADRGVRSLDRLVVSGVFGDGREEVRYAGDAPLRVEVARFGQPTARLEFGSPQPAPPPAVPQGDRLRDSDELLGPGPLVLQPLAPGVHALELPGLNARVFVVEFRDFLAVLEGTYNSLVGDRVVQALVSLNKPIRYFSFSHLHGQYIGGVRSFVAAGATVLVTPGVAPLVEQLLSAPSSLRPDALQAKPRPARIEAVDDRYRVQDADNELIVIHNRNSEHTNEYLNFYLPRQKILLSGDLFFYRSGRPVTGRSKTFCGTVQRLGLAVDMVYVTWPLSGFNIQTAIPGDDFRAACAG